MKPIFIRPPQDGLIDIPSVFRNQEICNQAINLNLVTSIRKDVFTSQRLENTWPMLVFNFPTGLNGVHIAIWVFEGAAMRDRIFDLLCEEI